MPQWLDSLQSWVDAEPIVQQSGSPSTHDCGIGIQGVPITPAAAAPAVAAAAVTAVDVGQAVQSKHSGVAESNPVGSPTKPTVATPAIVFPAASADQREVCAALSPADSANVAWLVHLAIAINSDLVADPGCDHGLVRAADGEWMPVVDKARRLLRGLTEVTNPKYAAPILAALSRFRQAVEAVDPPAGWRSERYEWPNGRD